MKRKGNLKRRIFALMLVLLLGMNAAVAYAEEPADSDAASEADGEGFEEDAEEAAAPLEIPAAEETAAPLEAPAPEDIWEGVSSNGDQTVGSEPQLIYTGGRVTFKNVISESSTPDPNPDENTPSGPYVTVVHEYYTNDVYDGEYKVYQSVIASKYSDKIIFSSEIIKEINYGGNTYSFPKISSEPSVVKVAKNATGNQGIFTLRYERTVKYTYKLTWDYSGGWVDNDTWRKKEVVGTTDNIYTFDMNEQGYGNPEPTRKGFEFTGWTYRGDGTFNESGGQISMIGVVNGTVEGELIAQWEKKNDPVISEKVTITVEFVDEAGNVVETKIIEVDKDNDYDVTEETEKIPDGYERDKDKNIAGAPTGTADSNKTVTVPVKTKDNDGGDDDDDNPTPTPNSGGDTPDSPTPGPAPGPAPSPAPGPTPDPAPTPGPEPIVPEPTPTVEPAPVVPTVAAVTPVAPTPAAATPAAEESAIEALADEAVPLAGGKAVTAPVGPVGLEDEEVPLAAGKGASWALINFALMNLAIFESVMLLIGYFVKTKNDKDEEEENRKLKKKGLFRVLSLPVAVISLIAFILTEDITLPTAFVDKYTIVMLIIAVAQTVVAALSNKKYEDGEEQGA